MKADRAERARERLVAEAKREPLPELHWDAMETSLMSRLGEGPRLPRAKTRFTRQPLVLAFAAAAMAGVAAAAVGVVRHTAPEPTVAVSPAAPQGPASSSRPRGRLNGNALAVGAVIAAGDDAVTIDHEGHATWTLDSDSSAHIEGVGQVVTIALDRGSLTARVVPSPRPESFVVRVERTRIAVHGTAFRVVRLNDAVRVEVNAGVVGIGPLGGPAFDVAAPSTATVTLDGLRTDQRHAQRDVPAKGEGRRHEGPPGSVETTEQAGSEQAEAPAAPEAHANSVPQIPARAPRASSPTPSIDGVVAAVRRCFREQTIASGDVHISVSTQMSLRVQPTGRVGEAVFTPPLAPGVRHCVDETVGALKFSSSAEGFAIDRVLELER